MNSLDKDVFDKYCARLSMHPDALEHLQGIVVALLAIREMPFADQLVLGGSTALLAAYDSNRFTNDLTLYVHETPEADMGNFKFIYTRRVIHSNLPSLLADALPHGRVSLIADPFVTGLDTPEVLRIYYSGTTKESHFNLLLPTNPPLMSPPARSLSFKFVKNFSFPVLAAQEIMAELIFWGLKQKDLVYFFDLFNFVEKWPQDCYAAMPQVIAMVKEKCQSQKMTWNSKDYFAAFEFARTRRLNPMLFQLDFQPPPIEKVQLALAQLIGSVK